MIFGETIPAPRVRAPIPEVHLVAVDVSRHSTTGPEPLIGAVFNCRKVGHFARYCPLVSEAVKKWRFFAIYIGVSVALIVCLVSYLGVLQY